MSYAPCVDGICSVCDDSADCDDGNPKTVDTCLGGRCLVLQSCSTSAPCPVGRVCKAGACEKPCVQAWQCEDNDPRTYDSCQAVAWDEPWNTPYYGCRNNIRLCDIATICSDNRPATADECVSGVCANRQACSAQDCPAGTPCPPEIPTPSPHLGCVVQPSKCVSSTCTQTRRCTLDSDCWDFDATTLDECVANLCRQRVRIWPFSAAEVNAICRYEGTTGLQAISLGADQQCLTPEVGSAVVENLPGEGLMTCGAYSAWNALDGDSKPSLGLGSQVCPLANPADAQGNTDHVRGREHGTSDAKQCGVLWSALQYKWAPAEGYSLFKPTGSCRKEAQ